ncbi:BgTH12-06511 [Blumeria graminis f. sp. triticale]|uniref:BgTH12-06511 n=1 Tax=Blumeria graminis f. sp. triticale TaxID=1689686 RepID=A0A9W4D3U1_BLUGR|nr:BgTH12-06511 [Blumeria graminis f. sp. triticale]
MNSDHLARRPQLFSSNLWSPQSSDALYDNSSFSLDLSPDLAALPALDMSGSQMPPLHDAYSLNRHHYPPTPSDKNLTLQGHGQTTRLPPQQQQNPPPASWHAEPTDDAIELAAYDADMGLTAMGAIGQAYTTDEHAPLVDMKYFTSGLDFDAANLGFSLQSRRMSGSSFTMSTTTDPLLDFHAYEEISNSVSDPPSFSNRNSLLSTSQLSPVASPRLTPQHRSDLTWTQSRGRASPSPRPSMRSVPYNMDSSRNKRWSTGSYAPSAARCAPPYVHHPTHDIFPPHASSLSSRHSSPILPNSLHLADLHSHSLLPAATNSASLHSNHFLVSSQPYQESIHFDSPAPPLPNGLFRMLQSNADSCALHPHYPDFSDPPDLFASLHDEHVPPPPQDMTPDDPELIPHEQELRFDGDLYTPRWVRGHGNKREGWCGICKPGRWLILKNSAYWYDKSFTHGISAATGSPFQEPQETRRTDGNPDVWEGFCGSCSEWVALVSSKKKGTTWFRHAYKCHTHPKIKDAPKRRRESLVSPPRTMPVLPPTPPLPPSPLPPPLRPLPNPEGTPRRATTVNPESHYEHRHHPAGVALKPGESCVLGPATSKRGPIHISDPPPSSNWPAVSNPAPARYDAEFSFVFVFSAAT